MDNSTEFPPSDELIDDPEDPFLSSSPSPPDASSPAPSDGPSSPSPSSSTSPPDPPEEPPPYNEPSPPKTPETTPSPPSSNVPKTPETTPSPPSSNVPKTPPTPSQQPPKDFSTSPPSEEPPQNPPPFKTTTPQGNPPPVPQSNKSDNSPPLPPSDDSNLSGSPPSPSSSGPPPGEVQLIPSPLIFSPQSLSDAPLIPPGAPAHYSSNSVSGKSESDGSFIGTTGVVAIGLVFGLLLLGVIGWTVWWLWHGKKKVGPERPTILHSLPQSGSSLLKMQSSPANSSSEYANDSASDTPGMGNSRNSYSYKELATATNEFSESNQLGEGGFGSVFKGLLPDGREVAVKQLKDGGGQGEREFRAEVDTVSRIHHRHLVSLVGYCIFNEKRLLVYDFVPNNTLHFHLHGKGKDILDWPARIKIATGAARGIAYLHEDCHPRIVHRDIKSSNILLDGSFEAQVSDFGLARFFSDSNTHVTTRVMGTFGYMAPEYASSGKLTEKSDVFSFGVVLLELITGRKPVDTSQPLGEESLVEWARPLLDYALDKEKFANLVDPRLGKNYVDSEMFRVIEAAAACVQYSALKRPKMSRILRAFDDMSDLSNEMRHGQREVLDSPRQSAEIRLFRRMAFGSQDLSTTDLFTQSDWKSEEK